MAQASSIIAAGGGNLVRMDLGAGIISLSYQGGSLINASSTMLMPVSSVVAIPDYR